MEPGPSFQVKRKPVGGSYAPAATNLSAISAAPIPPPLELPQDAPPRYSQVIRADRIEQHYFSSKWEEDEPPPPLPPRDRDRTLGLQALAISPALGPSRSPSPSPISNATPIAPLGTTESNPDVDEAHSKSFWQTALEETRHFAGGLLPHPVESTKHYSILRHSGAIVLYRGPETSVVVTILSSPKYPLPPDRSLWLQQRGYSGDTGMKFKALIGTTSDWFDVTPTTSVQASEIDPPTERAWQRDIGKAVKSSQNSRSHVVRETHVVRIPAAAPDGYFRILLCAGRTPAAGAQAEGSAKASKGTVLCPSPLFRLASTSTDSSVFRGAKLSTMPVEIGVKVASTFAVNTAGRYIAPVTGAVQSRVQKMQPVMKAQRAGQLAYSHSGLQDKFAAAANRFGQTREAGYATFRENGPAGMEAGLVVGPEEGPQQPYPLKFQARAARGQGRRKEALGVPTANLADFPDDLRYTLKGVYFGWACVLPGKGVDPAVSLDWHESIMIAAPATSNKPSVVARTEVFVHMLHDFANATFFDAKMKIIIMGFLHPWAGLGIPQEEVRDTLCLAAATTVNSLSREHWGPETTLERIKTAKRSQTMTERYVDTRDRIQKQVDRIPVHWAGVRTTGAELRDRTHGNGGYWIPR